MAQLVLLAWVWVISGGIALYLYGDELKEDIDALTAAMLVLAWPWWLVQYQRLKKEKQEKNKAIPIRIETKGYTSKGQSPKGR